MIEYFVLMGFAALGILLAYIMGKVLSWSYIQGVKKGISQMTKEGGMVIDVHIHAPKGIKNVSNISSTGNVVNLQDFRE